MDSVKWKSPAGAAFGNLTRTSPADPPLRIALVTETWHPAVDGIVTRLTATVRALREMGHTVELVAPSDDSGHSGFAGLPVHVAPAVGIPFIYGGKRWGLPVRSVDRALERFMPDVVHAVGPFLLGRAAVRFARRRRVPLVCSYHTRIAEYAAHYHCGFARDYVWNSLRNLHNQADINLAASSCARDEMLQHGIERVGVWQGGVQLDSFHPMRGSMGMRVRITRGRPARNVVLYVGRLAREKHLDGLRAICPAGGPNHLVLIGDGPDRSRLELLFQGLQVTFMGALSHAKVAEACASSDVFVFPSTTDTLGLVAIEALASGVPVVMADSANARELLTRVDAGLLYEPDREGALRAAVETVLAARLSRRRTAEKAARSFLSWEATTRRLVTHYRYAMRRAWTSDRPA